MVDILDYPCSFWPDIEKIIGIIINILNDKYTY